MRRSILMFMVAQALFLLFVSVSHSQYNTVQFTYNDYNDRGPQINDNGHVIWAGGYTGSEDIFLDDGTSRIRLGNYEDLHRDYVPHINNNGGVAWWGQTTFYGNWEVFLYDGIGTTQITDIGHDSYAQLMMNNNGLVVWHRCDSDCGMGGDGDDEIYLYDGSSTTQLTDNDYDDRYPRIDDNGYVVWGGDDKVFLYDGNSTTLITNGTGYGYYPSIKNGYVVWHGGDDSTSSREIFLYDGANTTQLTNNGYFDQAPVVNSSGHVAWMGCDGDTTQYCGSGDWEVFLYDGTSTTQLTNNNDDDVHALINDNGYVVWQRGEDSSPDSEIFLYDGTSTTQITDNGLPDGRPKINNIGHLVWEGSTPFSGQEVFLAFPCSFDDDYDGDLYLSAFCGGDDCNDSNETIYPTNPNTYCNCEEPNPKGIFEVCGGGIDEDCDGLVDYADPDCDSGDYLGLANAEASTFGGNSLIASGSSNAVALLLVPLGAVVGLRNWRRKR